MTLTRRTLIAATGATLAGGLAAPSLVRAAAPFALPPLPYAEDALAPTISARTVGLHYGKHQKGYFTKLNTLAAGTPYADLGLEEVVIRAGKDGETGIFNNAAQAWNHVLYWDQFKGGATAPAGVFAEAVERDFGNLEALKAKIAEESEKVFGTGWVWLAKNGESLEVIGLEDAGNPFIEGKQPLLGIDVWEHAYYLDYENRRKEHVQAVLDKLVNWQYVGERLV